MFRDDLIQCDRERLDTAIEDALAAHVLNAYQLGTLHYPGK